MTIQETVSKFLEPHAFTISPDGRTVLVKHQDNVKFLKNKLKESGLAHLQVSYFDGKRTYSEGDLRSVIVVGECRDKNKVFDTLDKLYSVSPFTRLVHLDVYPSHPRPVEGFAGQWARQKGIETKPVRVDWKLGKNAAAIRYGKLFAKRSRTRPDKVIAFTNQEETAQVKTARKAGVEVVFVD